MTDVLYKKAFRPQKCEQKCMGSAMDHQGEGSNKPMALEKKLVQAEEFLRDYYQDGEHHDEPTVGEEERGEEVKRQLEAKGYYKLTKDELVWGARTAWRNAPRCPARVIWKKLIVFDCRQLTDTDMMFMAICRHLEVTKLKFPQRLKILRWRSTVGTSSQRSQSSERGGRASLTCGCGTS